MGPQGEALSVLAALQQLPGMCTLHVLHHLQSKHTHACIRPEWQLLLNSLLTSPYTCLRKPPAALHPPPSATPACCCPCRFWTIRTTYSTNWMSSSMTS